MSDAEFVRIAPDWCGYEESPVDYLPIRFEVRAAALLGTELSATGKDWVGLPALRTFCADLEKLERTLQGRAELWQTDPNIELVLSGDGRGHIQVFGSISRSGESSMTYSFSLDQTYLAPFSRAVGQVLAKAERVRERRKEGSR